MTGPTATSACGNAAGDDTGPRGDNPNRTMLGVTELQWLEQSLLSAQQQGVIWKFVATSSPIDQIGAIGSGADGGKSWMGGYRVERNALMKFIADNHIDHVVFLSTDDHQLRINEVGYFTQFTPVVVNGQTFPTPVQSSYVRVPGAISIIAGPIGATGPGHSHRPQLRQHQVNCGQPGRHRGGRRRRSHRPRPQLPRPAECFRARATPRRAPRPRRSILLPDTFNYTTFNVSADGSTLTVSIKGIQLYQTNTFPQPATAGPVRQILSFQIVAPTNNVNSKGKRRADRAGLQPAGGHVHGWPDGQQHVRQRQ